MPCKRTQSQHQLLISETRSSALPSCPKACRCSYWATRHSSITTAIKQTRNIWLNASWFLRKTSQERQTPIHPAIKEAHVLQSNQHSFFPETLWSFHMWLCPIKAGSDHFLLTINLTTNGVASLTRKQEQNTFKTFRNLKLVTVRHYSNLPACTRPSGDTLATPVGCNWVRVNAFKSMTQA